MRQAGAAYPEMQLAERKYDLVMYLAHDIRTPLASVIGYLNLLSEEPYMTAKQRVKYTSIALEKMKKEFFEITRYNMQQIHIHKERIALYYMLVQLSDELLPLLQERGNTAILKADENLTICGVLSSTLSMDKDRAHITGLWSKLPQKKLALPYSGGTVVGQPSARQIPFRKRFVSRILPQ